MPFGIRSTRCGFAVAQVGYVNNTFALEACLLGPLPGAIQSTPAAEATALLFFIMNARDQTRLYFFSDCQWVVDGFYRGPTGTTGSSHVHADIWRRIWRYHDMRTFPIVVTSWLMPPTLKSLRATVCGSGRGKPSLTLELKKGG